MNLLDNINETAFTRYDKEAIGRNGFTRVCPSSLTTHSLLLKVRYHMKQVLACLLELKRRDVSICDSLSGKEGKVVYNSCNISYNNNRIRMHIDVEGRSGKSTKNS